FMSSRRRHTRFSRDWSSDVCSSDLSGGRHATSVGDQPVDEAEQHPLAGHGCGGGRTRRWRGGCARVFAEERAQTGNGGGCFWRRSEERRGGEVAGEGARVCERGTGG